MAQLTKQYPLGSRNIVSESQNKAEGVFLWVEIVVEVLVDRLEDGSDINDLLNKLRSLPTGLRDLYRRMISTMNPDNQRLADEIFQLFTYGIFPFLPTPEASSRPVARLEAKNFCWLRHNTEAGIRIICCGFLEVHRKSQPLSPGTTIILSPAYLTASDLNGSVQFSLGVRTELNRVLAQCMMQEGGRGKTVHTTIKGYYRLSSINFIKCVSCRSPKSGAKALYRFNNLVEQAVPSASN
ncbi:hypothetical protein K469DRAFT_696565 [Zopfia rhizophila CBS 207.26]|uniref:Uncharacterized protein n=1 Tax=Zopfia rhizophila CBS 207.26 TaxID=1314779 RepID=A0A6A6DEU3_9PEZI|nr:hypothetical protein K469DRAFT_696565 [Zopfia rhizophila CBS 207.26]